MKNKIWLSNTRYFVDPSIAAAALGLGPQDLIEDLNTFGLLFETMCIRDLRVWFVFHGMSLLLLFFFAGSVANYKIMIDLFSQIGYGRR